eukprot:5895087-Pyramimonas_sp.AAC.2
MPSPIECSCVAGRKRRKVIYGGAHYCVCASTTCGVHYTLKQACFWWLVSSGGGRCVSRVKHHREAVGLLFVIIYRTLLARGVATPAEDVLVHHKPSQQVTGITFLLEGSRELLSEFCAGQGEAAIQYYSSIRDFGA